MTTPTSHHGERDLGDSPTYVAALEYARRGWSLVALHWITAAGQCSCGRPGCKSAGKHPVDKSWQDPAQANMPGRWRGGNAENIGIRTGRASGFWVLDYDPADASPTGPDAGDALWHRLRDEGFRPHVRTGGGGEHFRFALPDDGREIRNLQSAGGGYGRTHSLPMGWDVRGEGGQVVAPPSVSAKGAYVELQPGVLVPPAWLLKMIGTPPDRMVSTAAVAAPTPSGGSAVGASNGAAQGSSHPAVRVQAYAAGALAAECEEYSQLTDGRRGESAAAFARSLVEIANLAGWSVAEGGEVYGWFESAMATAAANAGGGGYAVHEVAGQWARAVEHVGGRARVMPAALEVIPDVPPVEVGSLSDFVIVEPGTPSGGHGSTNGSAPHAGVNGQPVAMGGMPAPKAPPLTISPAGWAQVLRQDAAEEAKRWRAARDGGDPVARMAAMRAEIIDAKALKLRPRLRPIVDGLLYRNTLARINGASGDGKSLVTLDLAAHVAAGTPWAGRTTHAGVVVCLVAEGEEGVGGRVEAWERHHRREFPGDVLFLPRPVQVMGDEWPILTATLAEIGPVLVIGDTQARMTAGVNEIDNTELGEVVERLDGLRVATGAAVLLVHHYGTRGERGRGGTAITGALQTELGVKRTGVVIELSNPKSKDDAEMKPVLFDLVQVSLPDDNGIVEPGGRTAAIAVYRGEGSTTDESAQTKLDAGQRRARALWRIIVDEFNPGDGGTRADIKAHFFDLSEIASMKPDSRRQAWQRAWNALIGLGLIAKHVKSARFKIVEVANQARDGVLTANPAATSGDVGGLNHNWELWTNDLESKDQ